MIWLIPGVPVTIKPQVSVEIRAAGICVRTYLRGCKAYEGRVGGGGKVVWGGGGVGGGGRGGGRGVWALILGLYGPSVLGEDMGPETPLQSLLPLVFCFVLKGA